MATVKHTVWIAVFTVCACIASAATDDGFIEEFDTLDKWKPLTFPKIKKHSSYTIESEDDGKILKTMSKASASGLIRKDTFDVFKTPRLSWRWKVENVYKKGDATKKTGDDYPLRVYVIFKFDPKSAGWWEKRVYGAAKLRFGEYPPHSSLNYIWANKKHQKKMMANMYTEKAQMIILQYGSKETRKWLNEDVNILEDYRKAFGKEPPRTASIAIMSDSDNTKESTTAYLDDLRIYKK